MTAVTQGTPDQTRAFSASRRVPFPCLSDPERRSYRAYGLGRGTLAQVLGPRVLWRGLRAAAHGHVMGRIVGDEFQLGGTFIIHRGIVRFTHYPGDASDNASPEALLKEVARILRKRPSPGRERGTRGS